MRLFTHERKNTTTQFFEEGNRHQYAKQNNSSLEDGGLYGSCSNLIVSEMLDDLTLRPKIKDRPEFFFRNWSPTLCRDPDNITNI